MTLEAIGRILVALGIGIALVGGMVLLLGRLPFFAAFDNLPGDFRIQLGNVSCLFPLASMVVVSVLLTLILNIVVRLFTR